MFHKFFSDINLDFWRFYCGTKIFFGRHGIEDRLKTLVEMEGKSIGILSDENVFNLNFTKRMLSSISGKVKTVGFIGYESDYDDIKSTIHAFRKGKIDIITAIGGGSVLDGAKIVSVLVNNTDIDPMEIENIHVLKRDKIPLIAIPTTFGTGSEVNMYAHVDNKKNKIKIGYKKDFFVPDIAVINPDAVKESPVELKFSTGIDALTHVLDVLSLKREKSPIQETLMKFALELFLKNFRGYIENPTKESEDAIALVSTIGGLGVHNSRTGLTHTLVVPFGKHFCLPHSIALMPFLLPSLKHNWEHMRGYFNNIGFEDFYALLKENVLFMEMKEIEGIKVDNDIIDIMAEDCMKDTVIFKENPAPLSKDIFKKLYMESFAPKNAFAKKI